MKLSWIIGIAVLVAIVLWLQRRRIIFSENGMNYVPGNDADMQRAIEQARAEYSRFVARWRNPQPGDESFSIKAGIEHDGNTEHIWLNELSLTDDGFEGAIANDPQYVPYKLGDRWRGTREQLSDWTWIDNGRMQGNYTLRAMLPRMPKAQREQAQRMLDGHHARELVHRPWPGDASMPGTPMPDDISNGDELLMQEVGDHMERCLGKVPQVFHEIVSPHAHIDLYPYPATTDRPFHVVSTTGMAERAMQLPPGSPADAHVELLVMLPSDWPLDTTSWQDERHYWPLRWLKAVARYPYETGHWLGEGHVLLHGDPPSPIHDSVPFDSVVLARPRAFPPELQQIALSDGRKVRMLCLYFLDPKMRAELEERGWEDWASEIPPERRSV